MLVGRRGSAHFRTACVSAINGDVQSAGDTRNRMQIIELEMVVRDEFDHRHADFQFRAHG